MTRLILATDQFPYGKGEATFIMPELMRLRQHYDITIISHADREQVRDGLRAKLPEGVELICFGRPELSLADKFGAFARFLLDRHARQEIREIFRTRKNRRERLYQSLSFFAQALSDQKKLRQSGIFSMNEPVIYYSFWYTYFCYSAVRECGKRKDSNVRLITRAHGYDLYHERIPGNRQPFRHQMELRLDAILFVCNYTKKYYREQICQDIDEKKLYVCKLGMEAADVRMEHKRQEVWHLVSCSSVIPLKRISRIIDGLALLNDKIHWTHIGDGVDLQRTMDYAGERLGMKDNISYTFQGYMENDKVLRYYSEHSVDCFITTSETEGSPVSVSEAMKFGIPVIGTDVGGIAEMIQGNGILLPADPDGEAVAAAIQEIMSSDQETISSMRSASLALWKRDFDIDMNMKKVYAILDGTDGSDC